MVNKGKAQIDIDNNKRYCKIDLHNIFELSAAKMYFDSVLL